MINLIDGNALGHAYHRSTKLTVGTMETQAIFGMLKGIHAIVAKDTRAKSMLLWDGRADFRFEILPNYKGSREMRELTDPAEKAVKDAYRKQVPVIKKMFQLLGIRQITASNLEADDLAGYFVGKLTPKGERIRLVTGDSDWWQLISQNVEWYDPREGGKAVNHVNFFESSGYMSPREYLQGKALVGDSTDDIPPAGGIGGKGAPELLAQFGSIEEFWRRCDTGEFVPTTKAHKMLWQGTCELSKEEWIEKHTLPHFNDKQKKQVANDWPGQSRTNWLRNMQLMDLTIPRELDNSKLTIIQGDFNEDGFRELCERLAFRSITRDWSNFIVPFRQSWANRQAALTVAA